MNLRNSFTIWDNYMNRARHIYTCGHSAADVNEGTVLRIKSVDRMGKNCIDAIAVCESCVIWYRKNNLIIDHEPQAERWLARNKSIEPVNT